MTVERWTPSLVEERLAEAADTLKRLPPVRSQGYVSTWPPFLREACEAYGWTEVQLRLGPPSAAAIDRMDETLQWLPWLEPEDSKLVWARAGNRPWKEICWHFGFSRATAWRRWVGALCVIAIELNSERARHIDRTSGTSGRCSRRASAFHFRNV